MSNPEKNKENDFNPSWFLVILMLGLFWPVGLWFLWCKLKHVDGDAGIKKSKRGISGGGAFLLIAGIFLLLNAEGGIAWFLLLGGAAMLLFNRILKRQEGLFRRYKAVVNGKGAIPIKEVASAMGVDEDKAGEDLKRMIEEGWFGESAYVDIGAGYFLEDSRYADRINRKRFWRAAPAANQPEAARAEKEKPAAKAEPAQANEETPEIRQAREYDRIIGEIRTLNKLIENEKMSAQIDRIEEITTSIFSVVSARPKKKEQISTFMNYYLPTTLKLLGSYADLEKRGPGGKNIQNSKENIEKLMDQLVWAFEQQLDQMYEADALDIGSDIKVMEQMLARDGLADQPGQLPRDPFGTRGGTVATSGK